MRCVAASHLCNGTLLRSYNVPNHERRSTGLALIEAGTMALAPHEGSLMDHTAVRTNPTIRPTFPLQPFAGLGLVNERWASKDHSWRFPELGHYQASRKAGRPGASPRPSR